MNDTQRHADGHTAACQLTTDPRTACTCGPVGTGPDLTGLDLTSLTRLVAPGGSAQQALNQAVLSELQHRNKARARQAASAATSAQEPGGWEVLYRVTTDGCGTVRLEQAGCDSVTGSPHVLATAFCDFARLGRALAEHAARGW